MKIQKLKNTIVAGVADQDKNVRAFNFFIGIDPDVDASGFAVFEKSMRQLVIVTVKPFFEIVDELRYWKTKRNYDQPVIVHIEGGWLKKQSNWSTREVHGPRGESIARRVGQNQQVGKLLVEACIHLDISFKVIMPMQPIFKDEAKFQLITGWKKKTTEDSRSAALYVYGF